MTGLEVPPDVPDDVTLQWRVAARPVGKPKATDFQLTESPVPEPGEGEVLLKTLYLGLAPVMRMYMQGTGAAGERVLDIGDVIHGRGVAEVVRSNHPDYAAGDIVQGQLGWQTFKASRMTAQERFFTVPDRGVPYALSAGVLAMAGLSAYCGFLDCGRPKAGDRVVVSGAAGGVGSMVVQIARIVGCTVVGIAGGAEKCRFLKDLGVDAVIDYKHEDVPARIADLCPGGLDIYFDNVGGETLEACLENLAMGARVVLCGSISEYTRAQPFGLTNYARLRDVNGSMNGFFVYNFIDRFDEAVDQMTDWIKAGTFTPVQDIVDGFENMPAALSRLYDGRNVGVQCCRVRRVPHDEQLSEGTEA